MLERVPMTFLIMGLIILVLNLIGIIFMFENNEQEITDLNEETAGLINESTRFIFFPYKIKFGY